MAMEDPVGGHQEALHRTMNIDRIDGILRTGGNMTAGGWGHGRDNPAVDINRQEY